MSITSQTGAGNPNIPLVEELADAGVELLTCGQMLHQLGYVQKYLLPQVKMAYSGAIALVEYQSSGYSLIPSSTDLRA